MNMEKSQEMETSIVLISFLIHGHVFLSSLPDAHIHVHGVWDRPPRARILPQ